MAWKSLVAIMTPQISVRSSSSRLGHLRLLGGIILMVSWLGSLDQLQSQLALVAYQQLLSSAAHGMEVSSRTFSRPSQISVTALNSSQLSLWSSCGSPSASPSWLVGSSGSAATATVRQGSLSSNCEQHPEWQSHLLRHLQVLFSEAHSSPLL